ncbi:MAG: hypothetical protein ABI548_28665 [Polyangiaceae bacterium]
MVRRACEFALFLAALVACSGCKPPRRHAHAAGNGSAAAASSLAAVPLMQPLSASNWLVELDVPGFGPAQVAVPIGARGARPVVIALHGIAGRPEWACGAFRGIAGPMPFVLCPRGVLRSDLPAADVRYTFGSAEDTARELRAALTELKRKYGAYIAAGPLIFGGFEVGADLAVAIARQEPTFFSRLVLIEASAGTWPPSHAAIFARQGGARVLFAGSAAQRDTLILEGVLTRRGGAEAQSVVLASADLGPASVDQLAEHWAWLAAPPAPALANPQNLAGNALPAGGPVIGRPAP